jgi:hypothetical protein
MVGELTRLWEALKDLLAGSIPCQRICTTGGIGVLTFEVIGVLVGSVLESVHEVSP